MAISIITVESGYYQAVSGLSLSREAISVPFGWGTDWTKIGIGITAKLNLYIDPSVGLISTPTACGFQPDQMFWMGVKNNNGQYPNCQYFGDGDFIGFSSFSYSGGASDSNAKNRLYSQVNFTTFVTGGVLSSFGLETNFYGVTGPLATFNDPLTGINLPIFPVFPFYISPGDHNLFTSGDYVNFIMMFTRVPVDNSVSHWWGTTGEYLFDARPASVTGDIPQFLTKSPSLLGLGNTMDNFYSIDHSGLNYNFASNSQPNYTQDSLFISTPYTGWQITDILIKRYY